MARQSGQVVVNQFTRGLITEATGFNFPDNAAIDTDNCKYYEKGVVRRRLGLEYEDDYTLLDPAGSEGVIKEYLWKSVGTDGLLNFVVVQRGSAISFFEPDANGNISSNIKSFNVNLLLYAAESATTTDIEQNACEFASGKGRLFINHPRCEPLFVVYDQDTDTIETTEYEIIIRDFEGVDDGLETEERPTTLTDLHKYNLHNQGWYPVVECGTGTNSLESEGEHNVIDFWADNRSDYPSNADIWWIYKDSAERFNNRRFNTQAIGNSPAPKGHFYDNAFYFDRAAVSGISGMPLSTSGGFRPSCCAFFAGRVWYAGVNSPDYTGRVYYTQIVERDEQIGQCHQLNDPTSEILSDLLDTDGGVIHVLEASKILKMVPLQSSLLLFATNGVWEISGSQGTGFKSTDFSVTKMSSIGCVSNFNFVLVEGTPVWFNNEGIYAITPSETGTLQISSLTDQTIKAFFQALLASSIRYAKGAYNPSLRVIQWIYRSTAASTFADNFAYDKFLNFNTNLRAFYPWSTDANTVEDPRPIIAGIVCLDTEGADRDTENIVDNSGVIVTAADGTNVTVETVTLGGNLINKFKYIVVGDVVPEVSVEEPGVDEFTSVLMDTTGGISTYPQPYTPGVTNVTDKLHFNMSSSGVIRCWDLETGTSNWIKNIVDDVPTFTAITPDQPFSDGLGYIHFGDKNTSLFHAYDETTGVYVGQSVDATHSLTGFETRTVAKTLAGTTYLVTHNLTRVKMWTTTTGGVAANWTLVATNTNYPSSHIHKALCLDPNVSIFQVASNGTTLSVGAWGDTGAPTSYDLNALHGITDTYQMIFVDSDNTLLHFGPQGCHKLDATDPTTEVAFSADLIAWPTVNLIGSAQGPGADNRWVIRNNVSAALGGVYKLFDCETLVIEQEYALTEWPYGLSSDMIWIYTDTIRGIFVGTNSGGTTTRVDFLPNSAFPAAPEVATYRATFAEEKETTYHDWVIFDQTINDPANTGFNYSSYILTGAQVPGEGDKHVNIEYITVLTEAETNSSIYLQTRWDFANASSTSKWSTEQQAYSTQRSNRDVVRRRLLVRGQGPALQLYFRSEESKPFNLIGWSAWETIDDTT